MFLWLGLALLAAPPAPASSRSPGTNQVTVLDVPFVSQTEALCGGAALAMVLRYWGERDVRAEDFAALVDTERGGISTADLVAAARHRGFATHPFVADLPSAAGHLDRGRPIIALLEVAPGRHHYVVLVAWTKGQVVLHDPAAGSFRVRSEPELMAAWAHTGRWALLLLPAERADAPPSPSSKPETADPTSVTGDGCAGLVTQGIARARADDLVEAESAFLAAATICGDSGSPWRELAGLRFRQERWDEAARLAERAAGYQPEDPLTWRLLGTSRYLAGEPETALLAWNRVGEPRLDLVQVEGLRRTRPRVLEDAVRLRPREVLTPTALQLADRRLAELPNAPGARLRYQPVTEGRAEVFVSAPERPLFESWRLALVRGAADAATARETRARITSPTRSGETVELGARWWSGRPAAWLTVASPRVAKLPGVLTLGALWDEQSYESPSTSPVPSGVRIERRRRLSLGLSDWWTPGLRGGLSAALDRFDGREHGSVAATLEHRLLGDRAAARAEAAVWRPGGSGSTFGSWSAQIAGRSSRRPDRFGAMASVRYAEAGREAPLALWPGAGTGTGRPWLLRAHPLIDDGRIVGRGFGRRLLHAGAEGNSRLARIGPAALAAALFVDMARPWDTSSSDRLLIDVGAGIRLRMPTMGSLRFDMAYDVREGRGVKVSAGWVPAWPD